jgi:glycosyltransferase involved in cell wall biosynthesis
MSQNKDQNISIIIVNYNNAKYLKKSLNSALNQSYNFKEIIVVDDISNDNSIEILKKYKKKIKYYVNKKKTKFGSYNQINSYYEGFKKSKGKYIFFLDSDDYFTKNKVKLVIKKFNQLSSKNIVFDLPIIKTKKKSIKNNFIQKNFYFSNWPRFTPQSCITVERNYAKKIFETLRFKKFPTIWFDFRIASLCFLNFGNIIILRKYLTYYRQLDNSASKNFKTLSLNWWRRRNEAHAFYSYISKKLKKKNRLTPDKIITSIVNLFI